GYHSLGRMLSAGGLIFKQYQEVNYNDPKTRRKYNDEHKTRSNKKDTAMVQRKTQNTRQEALAKITKRQERQSRVLSMWQSYRIEGPLLYLAMSRRSTSSTAIAGQA